MRAMVTLARPGTRLVSGPNLAAGTGIPMSYLPQVMGDLVRAGLVANRRGRAGGYRLARPVTEITLLDVIEAVEGDGRRRTCVLRGGPCRGQPDGACDIHDAFSRAQEATFDILSATSLGKIARGSRLPAHADER
jgi:Rrf2 family protein